MSSSSSSSAVLRFFVLFAFLTVVVEMCGNVHQNDASVDPVETSSPNGRKRRSADIAHIELLTTLTSAGDAEFARIEDTIDGEFEEVLTEAHRQVVDGQDGGKVMKYMLMNVDCGEAQLFASAIKATTSFVTGGSVKCNDQITNF